MAKLPNTVQLKTFLSWGVGKTIGHETDRDGEFVTKVWCKLCAKHSFKILGKLRGQAQIDFMKYVDGSEFVSRHTVFRHINNSAAHNSAVELEKLAREAGTSNSASESGQASASGSAGTRAGTQPGIITATQSQAREAYRFVCLIKLIKISIVVYCLKHN